MTKTSPGLDLEALARARAELARCHEQLDETAACDMGEPGSELYLPFGEGSKVP